MISPALFIYYSLMITSIIFVFYGLAYIVLYKFRAPWFSTRGTYYAGLVLIIVGALLLTLDLFFLSNYI
jgi:membrane-bound ClpP family serine protease